MTVNRICANRDCRIKFQARSADVARGWAKFCSKRCKAIEQTRRTSISGPIRASNYDGSWDSHEFPR